MTGIVGSIQKFSTEDGPGIRTTVFLKGCPLECKWCHNPELIGFGQTVYHNKSHCIGCKECIKQCRKKALFAGAQGIELDREKCSNCMECTTVCYAGALSAAGKKMSPEEVLEIVEQDKAFYKNTGGGMTISGGELLGQAEFAQELFFGARKRDIEVVLDTSGYGNGDLLYKMARDAQAILYDLKSIDREKHLACTGRTNDLILENLQKLAADSKVRDKIIMRMPLVSGVNDDMADIKKTAGFYSKIGIRHVNLIAYHKLGKAKSACVGRDYRSFEAPSGQHLLDIKNLFWEHGFDVEIIGEGV